MHRYARSAGRLSPLPLPLVLSGVPAARSQPVALITGTYGSTTCPR